MTRTDPPRFELSASADLEREPQLAVLAALDATLLAVAAALDARHGRPTVACWAPDAPDDVRLAAAIVVAARSLRALVDEYDSATHTRIFSDLPF